MDVSVAEAKNRLTEMIRAVENRETVVITPHGKAVAQLNPARPSSHKIRWGSLSGQVQLLPG